MTSKPCALNVYLERKVSIQNILIFHVYQRYWEEFVLHCCNVNNEVGFWITVIIHLYNQSFVERSVSFSCVYQDHISLLWYMKKFYFLYLTYSLRFERLCVLLYKYNFWYEMCLAFYDCGLCSSKYARFFTACIA